MSRKHTTTSVTVRRAAALALSTVLLAGGAAKAADLTWNAENGTWFVGGTGADPQNWQTSAAVPSYFTAGDNAEFTSTPGGSVTVNGNVQSGAIDVTGGTYTFNAQDSDYALNKLSGGTFSLSGAVVTLSVDTVATGAANVSASDLTLHRQLTAGWYYA